MKLEIINKATYRKHLNIVIAICVVALAVLSLSISQAAIYLFTDREGSHFWLNVLGVVIAVASIARMLKKYSTHPFMHEVFYVWQLKQQINAIYRQFKKIEKRAYESHADVEALIILSFYYRACEQLYQLDDNTITMSALVKKSNQLAEYIETKQLTIKAEDYQPEMLKRG